ncbi:MAG: polyprenyl synthetase family protein [Saprospiraceae bacterium]|nr:polyprenyl synthetase family protein [Saprospiraceae bacterium]
MEFKDLTQYQNAFETYWKDVNIESNNPPALFSPISYIMSLGGKRIRPILCLLAYQLFKVDFRRAMPQALAIEVFHNFTLVHDDIMDQAPTRRGAVTVHEQYGTNSAILSGDAMLIMSYQYLLKGLDQNQISLAMDMFSTTALDICRGQQLDMNFEKKEWVAIPEYLEMIQYKTAVLLGLSLAMGGLVAGADRKTVELLNQCGVAAGMAFQIHDDYLDAFGNTQLTGKQRGGDIIQNKKTFLWITAYNLGGQRLQQELINWTKQSVANASDKVRRVLEIYQSLDIEGHCQKKQTDYTNQAIDALNEIDVSDERKQRIFDLMALLLSRSH